MSKRGPIFEFDPMFAVRARHRFDFREALADLDDSNAIAGKQDADDVELEGQPRSILHLDRIPALLSLLHEAKKVEIIEYKHVIFVALDFNDASRSRSRDRLDLINLVNRSGDGRDLLGGDGELGASGDE